MSHKKEAKNPYRDHTVEEVMQAESGNYYIQIGDGLFQSETGKVYFKKDRAEHFYFVIREGLTDVKVNGTHEEQEEAHACLLNLRIIPLRFH